MFTIIGALNAACSDITNSTMQRAHIARFSATMKVGDMLRFTRFSVLFSITLISIYFVANAQTPQGDNRPRTASISGRVTIAGRAAVNAKIVITEVRDRSSPENQALLMGPSGSTAPEDRVVLTDSEGRYRLTNLPEGRYETQAMLRGCVREKPSQNESLIESFALKEGESRENVDFALVRGGVITGRVTDTDGRPVIARMVTLQVVDGQGRRGAARNLPNQLPLLMNSYALQTDDRGIYRVFGLRAGRYLVGAGGDSRRGFFNRGEGDYPRVWYPDATDENKAKIIDVEAGGEVTGIDIKLGAAKRTFEAVGRVVDEETNKPIAGAGLMCFKIKGSSAGGATESVGYGNSRTDEQGNFRLSGLSSGEYQLSLYDYESFLTAGGGGYYSDETKFEIQDADVSGVEIRAKSGATISGVAVIEDSDPSAKTSLAQTMILAQSSPTPGDEGDGNRGMFDMSPVSSRIGGDGGFILKGVRPGKVTFEALGFAGRAPKIMRIERGGVEISDGIVVAGREQIAGVRIIFGKGSGVIRGQVQVIGGELPEGWSMTVAIVKVKNDGVSPRLFDTGGGGSVDGKGRFVIEDLLPGEYELLLVVTRPPGSEPNSTNQFSPAPARQKVMVAKGQESQVTMTLDLSKKDQEDN
jgi:protocatechuate 3,4-dioxygenase beta subunit